MHRKLRGFVRRGPVIALATVALAATLGVGTATAHGPGERVPAGPPGSLASHEVVGVEQRFDAGRHELTARCPEDKVAIGGGYQASADGDGGANTDVIAADFSDLTQNEDGTWQATSYTVAFDNSEATGSPSGQGNMRVRVTCAIAR